MAYEDYMKANKLAIKEFKAATSKGRYPYLPVLDEILSHVEIEKEVNLGVSDIPLNQVVGTSTMGRTQAFASNFMPLLEYGSEFSSKWSYLVDAQIEEGIHDSIKVYEYMNKYYVEEGNKRVSVLKYLDSPTISADVIRKVPKRTDDLENKIYYEFMDFYNVSKVTFLQFSQLGSYKALLEAMGKEETEAWSDDDYMDFSSFHSDFYQAFKAKGGNKLENVTCGDALLMYLSIFPYEEAKKMGKAEIKANVDSIWSEIVLLGHKDSVELLMDPTDDNPINVMFKNILPTKKKKVAFVYDKSPEESNWIYSHDLGRLSVQEKMKDVVDAEAFITKDVDEQAEAQLRELCEDGYDIIFTVTPQLIKPALKVAAEYPNVKILNCALNSSHNSVRTYYTRMYEAKFLTGMIAGAMAENDKIGYIADYPIFGAVANINSFALGARMVNPRAKVYLAWNCIKDVDNDAYFKENGITYISGQDMITPQNENRQFGLYADEDENDNVKKLAISLCHWGVFYEEIIKNIINGTWKSEETNDNKALNYWWGLSAKVIDVICSNSLPRGTAKLVEFVKEHIVSGEFHPFQGPLADQEGHEKCGENSVIKPEDIITMDWLVDNVVGTIPSIDDLTEEAKPVVLLRGIEKTTAEKGGNPLL